MDDLKSYSLPKGTVIHYKGIPFYLDAKTDIMTSEGNLAMMFRLCEEERIAVGIAKFGKEKWEQRERDRYTWR